MSDSDKMQMANMVINIIIAVIGWGIFIWATKKTIQAMLQVANPVAIPKKKRELIGVERRAIKRIRLIQVCTVFVGILEPLDFFFGLKAVLGYDKVSVALAVFAALSMFGAAIALEFEIRRIKRGEYLKDVMRVRHARKEAKRQQHS